jgi:hypothetical protein
MRVKNVNNTNMRTSLPESSLLEISAEPELLLLFLRTSIFFYFISSSLTIYYGNSIFLMGNLFTVFISFKSVPGSLFFLLMAFFFLDYSS